MPVRLVLCLLPPLLALGSGPGPAAARGLPGGYPSEQPYSVALHMHGSMSEQFGSMEWHTSKAESLGVDVIWWTDHDWRLGNWRHMRRYDFETAFWDAAGVRWMEPDDALSNAWRFWYVDSTSTGFLQSSLSDTLAFASSRSLRLEADGPPGPAFEGEFLWQGATQERHKNSLAKRVTLSFALFPETLDAFDARFVLEVGLSDHPEGQPVLRYVIGSTDGEGVHSIPLTHTPGIWNEYTVDVTADAIAHFTAGGIDTLRGEDNSLALVRIGLEARNAAATTVFFDEYRIDVDPARVDDVMMDRARAISAYWETLYPEVTQFVGTEISRFKAQPHLNGYAPDIAVVDYTGYVWSDPLDYAVAQIHAQDGAVSLNHAFGPQPPLVPETPEERAARVEYTKRTLIDNRAIGVDIFEVGYRLRGGMNLAEHLDLWDVLNANAIFVCGNGVTDSHGRGWPHIYGWQPAGPGDSTTNNFASWLFAEELSEAGFVRALKSGRAYFGDPYRFSGTLDLATLDGFRMGQIVLTDRLQHDVVVDLDGVPNDAQVRLRQAEIRESTGPGPPYYTAVNFLRDEILTGTVTAGTFRDTVTVDTTLPSFVRVEVHDGASDELVFGNPLHFVTSVPAAGFPPERVAARLGEVRLFLAEEFVLTDGVLDPGTGVLTLSGDETAPGLGQLSVDPGALGEPSAVVGAQTWSWLSGTLTLAGFSGAGSTIQVTWGATGVEGSGAPASELALSPGRPNPFGAGTLTEYVIPRAGWVRLEVLDVAGRRVRVLVLGFEEPGLHRVRWDGTDEHGRSVADGVYYLRLEHDGRRLVRKAVRIH